MTARFSIGDFGRILRTTATPCYVLDSQRQIVFTSDALNQLLGVESGELLDKTSHFSSTGQDRIELLVNWLSPPPEAFLGKTVTANIVLGLVSQDASNSNEETQADRTWKPQWFPFLDKDGETAGVVGLLYPIIHEGEQSSADLRPSIAKNLSWHERLMQLRAAAKKEYRLADLVGQSSAIKIAQQQAQHAVALHTPIFIWGPHGIGKRTLARAIHYAGAVDEDSILVLESSLLSPEQCVDRLLAAFKSARLKTLVIADVEALSIEAQDVLMRAMRKDPSRRVIATSCRSPDELLRTPFINTHSTNPHATANDRPSQQPLTANPRQQELITAISTLVIHLPELSSRPGDIPLLVQSIVEGFNQRSDHQLRGCSTAALERIASYAWPGQVTELRAAISEAREKCVGHEIQASNLPSYLNQAELQAMYPPSRPPDPIDLEKILANVERELLVRALANAKGNKTAAAQLVGLSRPRFYRRLVELGLVDEESAARDSPNAKPLSTMSENSDKHSLDEKSERSKSRNQKTEPTKSSESKSRVASKHRKLKAPPLGMSISAEEDGPEFIEDIPFIPTDDVSEEENEE